MNIAILHHHLCRGGVTQVIGNHLRALHASGRAEGMRIALVYGGRRDGSPEEWRRQLAPLEVSLEIAPALEYDEGLSPQPDVLAQQLRDAFQRLGFSPDETLLHVHNHSLGKNISLPGALTRLSDEGYRLLLQIHDFAEDFRPNNYRRLADALVPGAPDRLPVLLYPQAPQIHYAVLNRRDFRILAEAGVQAERRRLLPNPVTRPSPAVDRAAARERFTRLMGLAQRQALAVYPVRGIRRKNLGEALLWSALTPEACFALTLAPANPVEKPSYERWRRAAAELELPFAFDVGGSGGIAFEESLAAADLLLTTSVAEGFGMVFAEAWLAERWLAGRDLPEITADFVENGLQLPGIRPRLEIPLEFVDVGEFRRRFVEQYQILLAAYGRPVASASELNGTLDRLTADGAVDFASLPASLQYEVLKRVAGDASARERVLASNPHVAEALHGERRADAVIAANRDVIVEHYGLAQSGRRLHGVYDELFSGDRSDRPHGLMNRRRVLDSLLAPEKFRPIRTEA